MERVVEDVAVREGLTFLRRTAEGTVDGSAVHLEGRRGVLAICSVGSVGSGCTARFRLQHSDDGASWETLLETPPIGQIAAPQTRLLSARTNRKLARVQHDVAGTAGVVAGAYILLGAGFSLPQVNTNIQST